MPSASLKENTEVDAINAKRAQEILIGGRFRIQERLGGGAFGEVFKGIDVNSGRPVAMKMELTKDGHRSHLNLEHKIYRKFNECPVTVGIPQSFYCGRAGDYTIMVMELLGPCLEDLFALCHRKFTPKTVCMIGIQIIQRLQYLHSVGYLHRDIKPENFVMGVGNNSHVVYVIDVGLSKAWRDASGKHISYAENKSLTGTARYVSINTHQGIQQSRRDDLESVSYLLSYFVRGNLPWQGLKSAKKDVRFERIRDLKIATSPHKLCDGYPRQLGDFVAYTRGLEFEAEPDYGYCVDLLSQAIKDMGEEYDYCYQWIVCSEDDNASDARVSMRSAHPSGAQSAVAVGGSSFMVSSVFVGDSVAGELEKSQMNNNFIEEMQDVYGLNDYF
ncbi:putative mitochondrial casein kinase 1 isoform 2 [Leptomonas pyrrhocoris]|uniref:non-specific serine/threonine protein kinase n=1 Tax=Leptomonas pyrrhocoris TaxID=157538 RepID=A0A0N0DXX6_LEPPY|nr:putative mitochondrial casein kinase 1 isoform 2 [Leptomonas pyrrhocoris]KPA83495.1 putative mitochondrial casein kinase 1 isoform 2 [Leptomonas pyrrhocoris]|eukprot:XP_015661934.1 putative mitochondrial casein kinase 1 isoform 2 [Leptomonas pyrrhocoris]